MSRLLILLFVLPLVGLAQEPHAILASLNAYKQPNGILLRWVIKGGSQCNGTKVFRKSGAHPFELINHIPGICGSSTENETYQFFDESPAANTYNHYKLELGFQGFSDTITVFYENFDNEDYKVFSDYDMRTHRILFSNEHSRNAQLVLYNLAGTSVYTSTSYTNHFEMEQNAAWPAGLYIFRISGASEKQITGKLYFGSK